MSESAEQDLWQAVLLQAVKDAVTPGAYSEADRRAHHEAKAWLERGGEDFREVCNLAGFDPEHVRDCYLGGRINTLPFMRPTGPQVPFMARLLGQLELGDAGPSATMAALGGYSKGRNAQLRTATIEGWVKATKSGKTTMLSLTTKGRKVLAMMNNLEAAE
jgi:hypothetical protein